MLLLHNQEIGKLEVIHSTKFLTQSLDETKYVLLNLFWQNMNSHK